MSTRQRSFKKGDRVRVASFHQWMPDRDGTIKQVEDRIGNRFLVKFDRGEPGSGMTKMETLYCGSEGMTLCFLKRN